MKVWFIRYSGFGAQVVKVCLCGQYAVDGQESKIKNYRRTNYVHQLDEVFRVVEELYVALLKVSGCNVGQMVLKVQVVPVV